MTTVHRTPPGWRDTAPPVTTGEWWCWNCPATGQGRGMAHRLLTGHVTSGITITVRTLAPEGGAPDDGRPARAA